MAAVITPTIIDAFMIPSPSLVVAAAPPADNFSAVFVGEASQVKSWLPVFAVKVKGSLHDLSIPEALDILQDEWFFFPGR
jgi:hypothetical protein